VEKNFLGDPGRNESLSTLRYTPQNQINGQDHEEGKIVRIGLKAKNTYCCHQEKAVRFSLGGNLRIGSLASARKTKTRGKDRSVGILTLKNPVATVGKGVLLGKQEKRVSTSEEPSRIYRLRKCFLIYIPGLEKDQT